MCKVLIVDDEEMICKAIESKIQRLDLSVDIEVIKAGNGRAALEIAIACRPDIIITDICMPGMDGLELIKQVKGYGSKLGCYPNFIALSAYNEFDFVRQAFRLGVIDYLLKPVTVEKLEDPSAYPGGLSVCGEATGRGKRLSYF
jgi:YesN/AraC family two-component response regulator